jgi:hypothetical protein
MISYPKRENEHYLIGGATKSHQCPIAADATGVASVST